MQVTISPTQIDTWRTCKRKFAFTYLAGLPRTPSTKAQLIGIDLHGKVEEYLKTGKYDISGGKEADRLFPFLFPYLPPPGTPAEQKVTVILDGLPFGGKFDWHVVKSEIGDLKTTSSLQYAKTEDELAVHPQPLIYMKATGEHRGRWVYVQTKGPAKVRAVPFKADFSALDTVIKDGHDISRAWDEKGDPNSYPPTLSACDMYGGCPFRSQCNLKASDRLIALLGVKKQMGAQEDLDSLLASIGAGINPPVVAPPAEPLPPVLDPSLVSIAPKDEEKAPQTQREPTQEAAPPAEAPKKRGRPRKEPAEAAPVQVADPSKPIGTLYVSCMPVGKDFLLADSIFAEARAKVSAETGLDDYRLADYGKGSGALLIEVQNLVSALKPAALVVEDGGPEARVCLSALVAMSNNVVRRF